MRLMFYKVVDMLGMLLYPDDMSVDDIFPRVVWEGSYDVSQFRVVLTSSRKIVVEALRIEKDAMNNPVWQAATLQESYVVVSEAYRNLLLPSSKEL